MNKIIHQDLEEILSTDYIDWSRFNGKAVLVTGANGMLPAYMVFTLLYYNTKSNANCHVYALVRNKERAQQKFRDWLSDEHLHIIEANVADDLSKIDFGHNVDFIIHAASQASPQYYGIDPVGTIDANVLGTRNTLELARIHKSEAYLYFSSGDVYGTVNPEKFPFTEEDYGYIDILSGHSCYNESKRLGEQYCKAFNTQHGVPTKIVRIFHTFGPGLRLDDRRVFSDFVKNIVHNEDIVLHSDGSAVRLFCYVVDAVKAYFKVMLDGEAATAYNVANVKGEISIRNLAEMLVKMYPEKHLHLKIDIKKGDLITDKMKSPIIRAIPSTKRIESLGWLPTISLEEGFRRTIESFNLN